MPERAVTRNEDLRVRSLTSSDYDAFFSVFIGSFLDDTREAVREPWRKVFDPSGAHGVFDGEEMIGVSAFLRSAITLPGDTSAPVAAVTAVGVKPGHRRRGVLKSLMRTQLHGMGESRSPSLAALHASEGAIYGRFGYGVGSQEMKLSLPRGAAFRSAVDVDPRPVRESDREHAFSFAGDLYPSVAAHRVGWLAREASWELRVVDDSSTPGMGKMRFALHPDGYLFYRPEPKWTDRGPDYALHVQELVARTPQAYAALWRYLLDADLVGEVRWQRAAVDEPVVHMLADPRQAKRQVVDGLWLRLVNLDTAMAARRYSGPLDVVVEVIDDFCPWNAGRWRLSVDDDGAGTFTPSDAPAQLRLDVADLATAYLGGATMAELSRSGHVAELAAGAVLDTSRAFATDHAPHCQEPF